jgi:anti-anti-sigma factor
MPPKNSALPVNLELRVRSEDDAIVLHCQGQITAGETSRAFRSAVMSLLGQHHKIIIVDLSGIHCMDRNGLEVLVSLYSSARTARATLKYDNLTTEVSDSHSNGDQLHILAS